MDKKAIQTINKRQTALKTKLVERLNKVPIVQVACEQVDVSRSTYYRWRKEDATFTEQADTALRSGRLLINDLAESKLISAIKEKNMTAIIFWLKHNHQSYTTRVELTAQLKNTETLTKEQEQLVEKALKLASLVPTITNLSKNNGHK